MFSDRKLNRRTVLRVAGVAGGAAALAACGATPTPQVVKETVVVTQEVEKVVEKEVTTIVEGTPQVVKETVVVEKEVTAAPSEVGGAVKMWVFPQTEDDMGTLWNPLVARFQEEYPNIQPNIELLPWGGRREKMLTAFAAGEAPDIAYVNTDTLSLFGTNDVLLPLDDVVPQEAWDDLYGSLASGLTWEGKRVMYPTLLIGTGYLYNKGLFTEIGLDPEKPPVTWEEILTAAAAAKDAGYFTTTWSTVNWGDNWVTPLWQAGGNVYSEDLTKVLINTDAAAEALNFAVQLFKNEYVPREGAVGSEEESSSAAAVDYWIQGKAIFSGVGNPNITTNTRSQNPDIDFGIMPTWKDKLQVQLGGGGCWGLFKNSEQQQATNAWLLWLIEPEQLGFYSSVTKFAPPRKSAADFWAAEALPKQFTQLGLDYYQMNQDSSYFWQEGKVTCAPYFQAAVLEQSSVEDALQGAQDELQAIVDEWNAKRSG